MLRTQRYAYTWSQINLSVLNPRKSVVYDLFKRMLGSGPVYAALGNHDSYDQFASPCCMSSQAVAKSQQGTGCSSLIGR